MDNIFNAANFFHLQNPYFYDENSASIGYAIFCPIRDILPATNKFLIFQLTIMQPKQLLSALMLIYTTLSLNAQNTPESSDNAASDQLHNRNFIKINLTAIALKNYSVQYERVLNKTISLAVSFRTMPATTIPFKNLILNVVDEDDADTKEVIENFKLSNFAFTPEIRFYLNKKGYGQGFYIAPFYRYANFKTSNLIFDYDTDSGGEGSIKLSGELTANTGGLMFGAQWALGKHMCLDWWILGPHFGSGTGTFSGISSQPLTANEQNDLREELNDIDIPLTKETVNVNANGASLKLDGPWAGIRAGISLGIKF